MSSGKAGPRLIRIRTRRLVSADAIEVAGSADRATPVVDGVSYARSGGGRGGLVGKAGLDGSDGFQCFCVSCAWR